jgi:hypothetical protein
MVSGEAEKKGTIRRGLLHPCLYHILAPFSNIHLHPSFPVERIDIIRRDFVILDRGSILVFLDVINLSCIPLLKVNNFVYGDLKFIRGRTCAPQELRGFPDFMKLTISSILDPSPSRVKVTSFLSRLLFVAPPRRFRFKAARINVCKKIRENYKGRGHIFSFRNKSSLAPSHGKKN